MADNREEKKTVDRESLGAAGGEGMKAIEALISKVFPIVDLTLVNLTTVGHKITRFNRNGRLVLMTVPHTNVFSAQTFT